MKLDDTFKAFDITVRRAMEIYIEMIIFYGREMVSHSLGEKELTEYARSIAQDQNEFGFICNMNGRVTERYQAIHGKDRSGCFFSVCMDLYETAGGDEDRIRRTLKSKLSQDLEEKDLSEKEDYELDENY